MDFFDDDENVKAMRETARATGLVDVLVQANRSQNGGQTKDLVRQALRLLGASEEELTKR